MRKTPVLALLLAGALPSFSFAEASPREKIAAYFRGWYAHIPGSEVVVRATSEVVLPGLAAYRVERKTSSKAYQESNIVLHDAAAGEIFVGDVFTDPERSAARRPFDAARDLSNIEASLRELFGLPARVELGSPSRGALTQLTVAVRQEKERDSFARRAGFISNDGATLLLGEFQPLAPGPAAFRERLLAESQGVRTERGRFSVTEFLDFQCERCRVRTGNVRRVVEERGGAVEIRFLPLVKTHDWAFAAAESAAALAAVKPELYRRYEEIVFARAEAMSSSAARELAMDVAETAGARETFASELSSGRARDRVLRDIDLAMRLGVVVTPSFLFRGTLLPGEKGQLETYLWQSLAVETRPTRARAE